MSEENIDLLRRAWESFVNRDVSGLDYLHHDIEFELGPEVLPDGGVFRGHAGYREATVQWAGAWDDFEHEPVEFIDVDDDHAIVVARTFGRSKGTGLEFSVQGMAYLYTFAEGKILRIKTLPDRAAALKAASGDAAN